MLDREYKKTEFHIQGLTPNGVRDPFGRRIRKQVGSETTIFVYADEGLIGEYTETGATKKTYGWRPNGIWGTNPVFMTEGGSYYFYHNDHLGTPQTMTDMNGEIVWEATYEAFGKATVDPASVITNSLRFPGQYWDVETGLHWNWHRYYDPGVGRYVTEDPIGFASGDINVFAYVQNNPLNKTDPDGLWTPSVHKLITQRAAKNVGCGDIAIKLGEIVAGVDFIDGSQDAPNSFWHAMVNGLQDKSKWGNDVDKYYELLERGRNSSTLAKDGDLAKSLHAFQDSFAPAHRGFKPWYGNKIALIKHWQDPLWLPSSALAAQKATEEILKAVLLKNPSLCKCKNVKK